MDEGRKMKGEHLPEAHHDLLLLMHLITSYGLSLHLDHCHSGMHGCSYQSVRGLILFYNASAAALWIDLSVGLLIFAVCTHLCVHIKLFLFKQNL